MGFSDLPLAGGIVLDDEVIQFGKCPDCGGPAAKRHTPQGGQVYCANGCNEGRRMALDVLEDLAQMGWGP